MIALHGAVKQNFQSVLLSFWMCLCMEARQRSTVATCSHIGTRLAEARLNEHKVLHCPCKSSWSASQKHGDEWFQPNWFLLHPPMSSCVHDMMWTNVFSRFEKYLQNKRSWFLRHENLLSSVGGFALRISPDFEIKPTQSLLQIVSNCWCLLILMAEQSSRKKTAPPAIQFQGFVSGNFKIWNRLRSEHPHTQGVSSW